MAERPRLEAVLFDAGGTLVRLDFEWMAAMVTRLGFELPSSVLRRAEIDGRRAYDSSRGRVPKPGEPSPALGSSGDTRAYFAGMLDSAKVPESIRDLALERFFARHAAEGLWTRPLEGARDAIDGVLALGMRAAVVSNSDGRAEMHLRDCGVRDGLEFVIDSQIVGVEKPDPVILGLALERLGIAPAAALFVGDIRSVDEAVARAAKTSFVLVDPYGDYAPPGTFAIAGMALLPEFVAARFLTPNAAGPAPEATPETRHP